MNAWTCGKQSALPALHRYPRDSRNAGRLAEAVRVRLEIELVAARDAELDGQPMEEPAGRFATVRRFCSGPTNAVRVDEGATSTASQ
ncbi:hypothetical protein [Nocardia gamkensis]|uniref:Uncharacterized protein n=1 Tax=Nocardia gamkensis TaxID=352869 RepID=A0A7X6KZA2_9NOCA|nr:hypothetical protein [Nocardia gamkensis]NKY24944.1 hypothetical protein [Nocardia gamkensis]NQE66724.1 hypothetical protein [Nocardia gamkensis]